MQPVRPLACGVLLEHAGVGDAELLGQMRRDRPRDVGGVGQKRAQKTDGAELDGEPEAVALSAADVDQLAGGGVEMEVAVQLRLVGVIDVAPVAALLLDGEEPLAVRSGDVRSASIVFSPPAQLPSRRAGTGRRSRG